MVSVPGMLGRTGMQSSREISSREICSNSGKSWNKYTKQHMDTLLPLAAELPFSLVLWNQHLSPEQDAPTERS